MSRADATLVKSLPGPLRGLTETAGALPGIRLSALLVALALAKGCGDGPAAPPTPDPSRPTTVVVSPATVELTASGETVQLTAEVRDQNGGLMVGAAVRWSTSDPSVASVNASGLVTGVGEGVATITARAGSGEGTAEVRVAGPERAALEEFYEATDGPNWVNSENWLTDGAARGVVRVETDADGRVVELDLAGRWESETRTMVIHGLSGPIPSGLGRLAKLTKLDLDYNHLRGPIPAELAGLEDLTELSLRKEPAVPAPSPAELGNLARLETLDLYHNGLSGPIPPELGRLRNLRWAALSRNDLSGPIPTELGDLLNLTYLSLWGNGLSGPIPQSFLGLGALERFRFERNAGLCTPGTTDYVAWTAGIEASGPYCNESDVGVLDLLYETAGGPHWIDSGGWLETPALDEMARRDGQRPRSGRGYRPDGQRLDGRPAGERREPRRDDRAPGRGQRAVGPSAALALLPPARRTPVRWHRPLRPGGGVVRKLARRDQRPRGHGDGVRSRPSTAMSWWRSTSRRADRIGTAPTTG